MERFKACEKEMKTKAYSKEGLINSTKLDPREKEKAETSAWVSNNLEELEHQVEALEAEQETIQGSMKKGRKDTAKQDRISEIEDALDRHRWHIEKLEIILRMLENGTISPDSVNTIQDDVQYYVESNQDVDFAEDDEIYNELNLDEEDAEESYVHEDTPSYSLEDLATENSGSYKDSSHSASTQSTTSHSTKSETSSSTTSHATPVVQKSSLATPVATAHPIAPLPSHILGGMKPAPPPVRSTNELKYASAAAAGSGNSIPQGLSPLPPPSATIQSTPPATNVPVQPSGATSTPSAPAAATPTKKDAEVAAVAEPIPETNARVTEPVAKNAKTSSGTSSSEATSRTATVSPPNSTVTRKGNLPPGLLDLISSFEAAKSRIGTPPPISSISKLLESSYMNCPDSFMANKPKYYQPASYFPTPSYYPQEPLAALDDASTIGEKMDIDTLFYIFYYRQGTYQQALAAKELKNRSWRFHKRFLTWFQRHEEPKEINNDYEQGTYRYFDFEGLWLQRRKSNFKFEYQYLEDDI